MHVRPLITGESLRVKSSTLSLLPKQFCDKVPVGVSGSKCERSGGCSLKIKEQIGEIEKQNKKLSRKERRWWGWGEGEMSRGKRRKEGGFGKRNVVLGD